MKVRHFKTARPSMYPQVWINFGPGLTLREDANWRNFKLYNGIGFKIGRHLIWLIARGEI